jgi:hypothetical protein
MKNELPTDDVDVEEYFQQLSEDKMSGCLNSDFIERNYPDRQMDALWDPMKYITGVFKQKFIAKSVEDQRKQVWEYIHARNNWYESQGKCKRVGFWGTDIVPLQEEIWPLHLSTEEELLESETDTEEYNAWISFGDEDAEYIVIE